ncbi:DNA/RNA nuclease SfsA [Inconstantimicrobium mannanitabidum]|uniref:Sugar fermentation stimulation protein n=1 Tax=Inconstantimicrobium mannanitabidum TaxID=1604901 RepID=A0ACB5RFJ9_9CLOT|nr:DNA/RNA nuclease SfsA [Clostridium sp. TW13]GKX67862.1 sugar fermentation stimulation protein [Clostridium sp. TW13]
MYFDKKIVNAIFLRRPNRFQAYVKLRDEEIMVHVPNTGRCKEILTTGTTVLLREELGEHRKTAYDLIAGYKGKQLINIDSQIPNKVVFEALKNKKILNLEKYNIIEREKTFGNSRFDFKLSNDLGEEYYLEVKGVTYEENGVVMFPDAPTERGKKHLLELIEAKKQGKGAGVLFLIQLDNVRYFTPYKDMDPNFSAALKLVVESGVDVMAYCCYVTEHSITLKEIVRVKI